ncbi:MAG: rhomboid family intramembrane serine protease [Bacteroidetes bacterium]|nr:MAG: rhomboid family intramembrane serine protease [Bacteroidota bacterium]
MYSFHQKNNTWKDQFLNGSLLMKLIFINAAIYLLINLVSLFALWFGSTDFLIYYQDGSYTSKLTYWLAASSSFLETIKHPWSVITYMFLHERFWHLIFNMVFLYFSGRIFVQYLGERRLFTTYVFGGLAGLLLYMIAYSVIPYFNSPSGIPILGASASVMAIFIAIAAYQPALPVLLPFVGQVKLKYIAIFYLVMDFISIQGGENVGGHIAHLGGALFGFWAITQFRKGKDIFYDLMPIVNSIGSLFKTKSKLKVKYRKSNNASGRARFTSDEDYNVSKKKEQERIDEILDKISKSGYDSLSKKDKDFLFKQSSKNQN